MVVNKSWREQEKSDWRVNKLTFLAIYNIQIGSSRINRLEELLLLLLPV